MISKKCKGCLTVGERNNVSTPFHPAPACHQCRRKTNNANHRDYYHSQADVIHSRARDRGMGIAEKDTGCGGPRDVLPSYTRKELKQLKIKTVGEAIKKNKYYPGKEKVTAIKKKKYRGD